MVFRIIYALKKRKDEFVPVYKYEAINKNNKKVVGAINGKSVDDVEKKLYQQGLLVKELTVSDSDAKHYSKVKTKQLSNLCKELGNMLSSGIPLLKALGILKKRNNGKNLNNILNYLYKEIQVGTNLSTAMESCGEAFPVLLINMVKAGESNGQLGKAFDEMAVNYEKENRMHGKIKAALTYPLILVSVCMIALILMFTMILPSFFQTFEGMELPVTTKFLMGLSSFMTNNILFIILFVICMIVGIKYFWSIDRIKIKIQKKLLHAHIIGKLLQTIYTARFARTLNSLYSSGIPLIRCINICSSTIGNLYIESQFKEVIRKIKAGFSLTDAIAIVDGFDEKLIDELYIGEESGRLELLLISLADSFDAEAQESMSRLTSLIEPVLIIFIAVAIGFIAISVITPLMSVYDTAGNASSYL